MNSGYTKFVNEQILFFALSDPFISYQWNDDYDSLKFSKDFLYLRNKKQFYQFAFSEIISAELLSKKKLAPLVSGAIISSLAAVNILLEGSSLYMVAILFIGLLILYIGLNGYWVVKIVTPRDSTLLWLSKNKNPYFPEVILNVVHYRIKQGVFPPLYCQLEKSRLHEYIEEKNEMNPGLQLIHYSLLSPKPLKSNIILKVDPTLLTKPLTFEVHPDYLASGTHKINSSALLDMVL